MSVINFFNFKNHSDNGSHKFRRIQNNNLQINSSIYLVQQIIPRIITATARILTTQVVGRQIAITHPTPKAIHKKSLRHIFFIVITPRFKLQPVIYYVGIF